MSKRIPKSWIVFAHGKECLIPTFIDRTETWQAKGKRKKPPIK